MNGSIVMSSNKVLKKGNIFDLTFGQTLRTLAVGGVVPQLNFLVNNAG